MASSTALAVSDLAWKILSKLLGESKQEQAVFFSPLSIVVALGMLIGAADDMTRQKLFKKLGVQREEELYLITNLSTSGSSDTSSPISVANAIFTDRSITLFDTYKAFLKGFRAESFQYPNLAEAVESINSWISDNTEGLIKDMLSKALLKQLHTVIVNALAFKGDWKTPFDEANTQLVPFHLDSKQRRSVHMMHLQKPRIWCRLTPSYDAVRLPYEASGTSSVQTSLVAYLPKDGITVEEVIDVIKAEGVKPLDEVFKESKYDRFGFPRFEITGEYSLKDSLRKLGFPLEQSFPHMGTGECFIHEVIHKAFVKVDEKGTTAAAATAVLMTRGRPLNPKTLIFDKPFVFAIVADDSGANIFSGVYYGD